MRNLIGLFALCMALTACKDEEVVVLSPADVQLVDAGGVAAAPAVAADAVATVEGEEQAPVPLPTSVVTETLPTQE